MIDIQSLKDYLTRSGDDKIYQNNLISNEHGFMSWVVNDEGNLVVLNCYGDGAYWDKVAVDLAKKHGCKKVSFGTKRNYKAFERKFGYKLIGYILEKEVDNG